MQDLSPSYDNKIERKYSVKTLEHKVENKLALQKELGWPTEKKIPLLCIPTGMTDALGGQLLKETLPGILTMGMEIVILGKGDEEYGALFTKLTKEKGHRIAILKDDETQCRKMYAAADMALFFTDSKELPEEAHCLHYGVVPIAPHTQSLQNYNPVQESGNAFLYDELTKWHCYGALVRALETYNFPFDWRTIQRQCMDEAVE